VNEGIGIHAKDTGDFAEAVNEVFMTELNDIDVHHQ